MLFAPKNVHNILTHNIPNPETAQLHNKRRLLFLCTTEYYIVMKIYNLQLHAVLMYKYDIVLKEEIIKVHMTVVHLHKIQKQPKLNSIVLSMRRW